MTSSLGLLDPLSIGNMLVNGLLLGGLFALTAFGLSVFVGVMRVINIAHGDLAVLSAYFALSMMLLLKVDPFISLIAVMPIMFVIGYTLQRFVINRLLPMGANQPVIATFALSIVIQNLLLLTFTADARSLIVPYLLEPLDLFGISISRRYGVGFLTALIMFVAIYFFLKRTYIGKAMRAVPFDIEAAKMLGIRPHSVYNFAAGLAMIAVAVAGVLLGMVFTFYPNTGPMFLLLSFGAIVVGGVGSLKGTLVGGIIIGEALVLGGYLGSYYQLMFCYLVILAILIARPQGIFGERF
ncbi:MAG: branched-chain amino acid ABC transporter permease [Candidatus Nezhaarchaeales archaeon]